MRRLAGVAVLACLAAGPAAARTVKPSPAMLKAFDASGQAYQRESIEDAARNGDAKAQLKLGELYRFGQGGFPQDVVRACNAWELAKASEGAAAHDFAQCFYDGIGRARDYGAARVWYRQGVDLGFVPSKCALGNMLVRGLGGASDATAGLALCREAAEAGDVNAQADLGDYYLGAGGVLTPDPAQAKVWYEKAAVAGQPNAAFNLAVIYWNGDGGVLQDQAQAVRWWRFAYAKGRAEAAKYLGDWAYLRFRALAGAPGGAALLDEAIDWYQKAVAGAVTQAARADAQLALTAARAIRGDAPGRSRRGEAASAR